MRTAETELAGMRSTAAGGAEALSQLGHRLDDAQEGIERLAEAVVALADDLAQLRQGQ